MCPNALARLKCSSTKNTPIPFGEPCLSPLCLRGENSPVTWAWPTRDWFRDGYMSKAGPMRTCPGTVAGTIEKDVLCLLGLLMPGAAA